MFIQPVPCDSDAFSHGKGGYNGTNSKSFDMSDVDYQNKCQKYELNEEYV